MSTQTQPSLFDITRRKSHGSGRQWPSKLAFVIVVDTVVLMFVQEMLR